MSLVSEAVFNCSRPDKLNYELLGNGDAHMHWHLFPRRKIEAMPHGPVWWTDQETMNSDKAKPTEDELRSMKADLCDELYKVAKEQSSEPSNVQFNYFAKGELVWGMLKT